MAKPSTAKMTRRRRGADAKSDGDSRAGLIVGLGAGALAIGAALFAFLRGRGDPAGHAAPDLAPDAPRPGTDRAPDAFRPDPTAVPTKAEYDSLRPATGPAPSMVQGEPGLQGPTATKE